MQDKHEDRNVVYEIGYLIASSIPEEKVEIEVNAIKKVIGDAGAVVISEGTPYRQPLSYTIRKKTVTGSYDKYDQAYFGWIKFEVSSSLIESIKKAIEIMPAIIRILVIVTVKEDTYLGKHASISTSNELVAENEEKVIQNTSTGPEVDVQPATIEEIDKSIDAMVKE